MGSFLKGGGLHVLLCDRANMMANWGLDANFLRNFTVSDSGWMTAEVFQSSFAWFAREVTAQPLLLIMDGHSSHLNYSTQSTSYSYQLC